MRNLYNTIYITLALFLLGSCRTEMIDYSGSSGLYFAVQHPWVSGSGDSTVWEYSPVTEIPFIMTTSKDSLVRMRINITGNISDKDRYFKVAVEDTGTNAILGQDFEPPADSYKIAAGMHFTDIYVKFFRTPALKDTFRKAMFRLVQTPDFTLPIDIWYAPRPQHSWSPSVGAPTQNIDAIRHTVVISDVLRNAPAGWFLGIFGDFSKKKFELLCEWYNLSMVDFLSTTVMPINRARSIAQRAKIRLDELTAAGNPVMEADGVTPMKMGSTI